MRRLALFLAVAPLTAACTPTGGADMNQAVEAMIEVKLEMRMAIDELRQARSDLDGARAEIDRARGDLDRARRALERAEAGDAADLGDAVRPSLDRSLAPELAVGITCESEGLCTITRSTLDALFANPAQLAKQARIVPAMRDGETVGMKFYGVRRGSLPQLVGLHNGDLLTSINGKSLASMEQAMEAYSSLRGAKKFEILGERKGEPLRIMITIADG